MFNKYLRLLLISSLLLIGCGQKGNLYLKSSAKTPPKVKPKTVEKPKNEVLKESNKSDDLTPIKSGSEL